jgi:hypothetical protein
MEDHELLKTNEARGGATPHVARYVLMFSLIAIIVAFGVLLFIFR